MPDASTAQRVGEWASSLSSSTEVTLQLRNIPTDCTKAALMAWIDSTSFRGTYDYLYLPRNFTTGRCLGYAFINFLTVGAAERFTDEMDGLPWMGYGPALSVSASTKQGLAENLVCWVRRHSRLVGDFEVLPFVRQLEALGASHPCQVPELRRPSSGEVPMPSFCCARSAVRRRDGGSATGFTQGVRGDNIGNAADCVPYSIMVYADHPNGGQPRLVHTWMC